MRYMIISGTSIHIKYSTLRNLIKIVEFNIMENEHSRSKLSKGMKPDVHAYHVGDILVGIDTISGEFCIECEDIKKAIPIYDGLFVYRGLDENDLKNYVLVAEYVKLTQG